MGSISCASLSGLPPLISPVLDLGGVCGQDRIRSEELLQVFQLVEYLSIDLIELRSFT
jgi:hypothetical protein